MILSYRQFPKTDPCDKKKATSSDKKILTLTTVRYKSKATLELKHVNVINTEMRYSPRLL